MFTWIGNLFSGRSAVDKGRKDPVLATAVEQSAVVYSQIPLHQFIDEQMRLELARKLFLEINDICKQRDPIAVCRERFAAVMHRLAAYQVLLVPPPPEKDRFGLSDQPGISGMLGSHLAQLFECNDELRSALFRENERENKDTNSPDLWQFAQREYWISYWHLETLDALRVGLDDWDEEADWKQSFLHAAAVNREHQYRWELELPSAFDESIAKEAATAYSMFTDIVVSGAKNPAREWRDYYHDSGIPMPNFGV
ncbi:MAG: hypothetical protein ACR2Q3_19830 [Woeseiaceae bacterium]